MAFDLKSLLKNVARTSFTSGYELGKQSGREEAGLEASNVRRFKYRSNEEVNDVERVFKTDISEYESTLPKKIVVDGKDEIGALVQKQKQAFANEFAEKSTPEDARVLTVADVKSARDYFIAHNIAANESTRRFVAEAFAGHLIAHGKDPLAANSASFMLPVEGEEIAMTRAHAHAPVNYWKVVRPLCYTPGSDVVSVVARSENGVAERTIDVASTKGSPVKWREVAF